MTETETTIDTKKTISVKDKIENDIMNIFNTINTINNMGDLTNLSNEVKQVLYSIFINNKLTSSELNLYTKDLYKMIIYFCKEKLNASISIICGFIEFGKNSAGTKYKPMIDYFMMETVDVLLKQCGWYIIKPLMNMLRNSIHKYQKENTFNYISNKIINQLNMDIISINSLEPIRISNVCNYVPRERSFTFGWYSYYIACQLYGNKNYYKQTLKQTHIRNYLMNYRKIINELRKHVIDTNVVVCSRAESLPLGLEMNYNELKVEFNKLQYKDIDKIVDSVLLVVALVANEVAPPANEVALPANEVALVANEVALVANEVALPANEVAPVANEVELVANEVAPAANEILLTPQDEIKKSVNDKNTWFSGWFSGWV
jgi:hypothetical protein